MKAALATILALLLLTLGAHAYDGLDLYDCVISDRDRVNSKGAKLTSVRAILAQDRANYHKFRKRDAKDSKDRTFTSTKARLLWQTAKIDVDPALAKKILKGETVEVSVFIYTKDHIGLMEGLINPNAG